MFKYDLFISHASEDKRTVAEPLARLLTAQGLRVWLDKHELTLGDSLLSSIDKGLTESRFGVVILSPSFFRKRWPRQELSGLIALEADRNKVVLPVWHEVTEPDVRRNSPILADRMAASTEFGLDHVVEQICQVVKPGSAFGGVRPDLQGHIALPFPTLADLYRGNANVSLPQLTAEESRQLGELLRSQSPPSLLRDEREKLRELAIRDSIQLARTAPVRASLLAYVGAPHAAARAVVESSLSGIAPTRASIDLARLNLHVIGTDAGWAKSLLDHQAKASDCEATAARARSAILTLLDADLPIELRIPFIIASLKELEEQALRLKMSEVTVVTELERDKRAGKSAPDAAALGLSRGSSSDLMRDIDALMKVHEASLKALSEAMGRCQDVVAVLIRGRQLG